jgi:putative transposase
MKSIKVRLELNNKQTTLANKHAGVARYAYNWGKSVCDLAIQNYFLI